MIRKYLFILILLTATAHLFAGVTGKISGLVTDAETGEALPGVNVVLEGTNMGAATGINGEYIILNVPVGTYELRASMMGYTPLRVENVRVSIDITTKQSFQMSPKVLDIAEEVTIVASRPMIQKDEVSTRHFVSSEEIELQPVDSFQEIAKNQAGVVGNHFRGGRSGEVLVLVDGIPVRDPAGFYVGNLGSFTTDVPEYGIQELEVSLGGFSAEYGNVQSGILNLAMKEGATRYTGKMRAMTTNFGSDDLNTSLLENIYEINLNGPEPITTTLLPSLGLDIPGSMAFSLSTELTDKDRGYYPNQQSIDQSYQGKLTYKITPNHKLIFGGLFSDSEWDQYYFPASKYGPGDDYQFNEYNLVENNVRYRYQYVFDPTQFEQGLVDNTGGEWQGQPYSRTETYFVAGMQNYLWDYTKQSDMAYMVWTHTLSPKTYYEVRLQNFYTNYHYATPDVEDRDGDGDTDEDLVWDINQPGPHPIYREREDNYWWVRGDDPGYRDQSSWTKSVKADLISQVTNNHMLKGGIELFMHRTKVENISWTLNLQTLRKDIWDEDSYDFGAYIQDKLEFQGIIALIGLRYDRFNPNGLQDAVYFPADFNRPFSQVDEDGLPIITDPQEPTIKHQISPRIGISHPITDRDVLHYTYGHYFQRPDGYFLYRNNRYRALTKTGNNIGNPNLEPEKTVAYEVGLEHQFSDDFKGTITGYYKDVSNLMDYKKFVGRTIQNIELNVFQNADYGNIKGMELTFKKRVGRYWGGSINYTYSIAKGRSSSPWGGYGSFTDAKRMNLLDHDQTHTVNANLTLQTPENFGFSLARFRPLGKWIINFQFDYGSGLPYSSYGTGKVNDQRMPWTSTTDVKLLRKFDVGGSDLHLFMDVFNLFNRENLQWLGSSQYYQITGDPSIVRLDNISNQYIRNPSVYSASRQFRIGIAVQF
ncbi:TonB-dependent receptor [candidate division KSB1 bacterium]|nr:TonB-dependent receptor [candidate division KSB1 bacterium]